MSVFDERARKPSLLSLIAVAIVCIGVVAFMIPFLVTGDFRWFLPGVSDKPSELLVWQQGEALSLKPGDQGFEEISREVDWALSHIVQYSDFGPSPETLEATREGLSLEVLYGKPIKIHSQWNMGNPSRLLFPLSGYYFPERRFYLGQEDRYRAGGPQVEDNKRLLEAVTQVLTARGALRPTATPELASADVTPTEGPTATAQVAIGETSTPANTETAGPGGGATAVPADTATAARPTASPAPPEDTQAGGVSPEDSLARIDRVRLPERDLYALHQRLKLKSAQPPATAVLENPPNFTVGDTDTFWVNDIANNSYYTITAELVELSEHGYWWVAEGHDVEREAILSSAEVFEEKIYPITRETFGSEPGPGIENDPRINVLYAPIPGVGGYFSSADAYPRSINEFSNQRKMIYIASDPSAGSSLGTLAHEFQHMIHFARHHQQDVWINEGMSELAMKLNGYDPGGVAMLFLNDTDVQLNHWADIPDRSLSHYGASYLFIDYFYQQYGGAAAIEALLEAPGTSLDSVDNALASLGRRERFQNVFTNWALANWLDQEGLGGRYEYPDNDVQASPHKTFSSLPARHNGTLRQQAAEYIEVTPRRGADGAKVTFEGDATVQVVSASPHSGEAMWWTKRGDLSNPTLTREFDLSGAGGKATLSFWLWYDIEQDYDYGYVEVSTDGGATWETLPGRFTTEENPVGTNFGYGYTGKSGGTSPSWVQEQVDLSAYAGKRIQVRFEYITDDAYNSQGMAIDDIRIPEIGYAEDAETGGGGWQADGFVRIGAAIPQEYSVGVISYPQGGIPRVEMMSLDEQNKGELTVSSPGSRIERVVVMVAALAPYTIQGANYRVALEEAR